MLSYFPFYTRRFLLVPYNIPYRFIEFPVEQDNFMSSADLFPFASENVPYFHRHSGSFSFFQKVSHKVKILLSVVGLDAVYLYLDIQNLRFYHSQTRSLGIQPFYRLYERQDKLFYFPLFKGTLQVHITEDFPAFPPDIMFRLSNCDLKQVIFPEINQPFPIPEPERIQPQQFSVFIDASHSDRMPVPILFTFFRGGSDKNSYLFFFSSQSGNLGCY